MVVRITPDLKRFNQAVHEIATQHKKVAADEINRRAVQVLIGAKGFKGAVHLTRKATEARIRKDLNKTYHVAGRRGQKSGGSVKLIYILASKLITKNGGAKGMNFAAYRSQVGMIANNIFLHRVKSRAFLAAGWLTCAHELMAATPDVAWSGKESPEVKVYPGWKDSESWAKAATPRDLTAICYNVAAEPGTPAGDIVQEGLDGGIMEQQRDMEEYLQRKLENSAKRIAEKA